MPFARAIQSTKHQIKASTQSIPSCAVWRRSRRKADGQNPNGQTARSSRRARRGPTSRCLALKTVTGIVTDDPKHTKAIVEQHFRALGRPQAGTRHLPDDERCSH
jgi:hypothetical protein